MIAFSKLNIFRSSDVVDTKSYWVSFPDLYQPLTYATATPPKNCIGPEQGEAEYSGDFMATEPHLSLCSSIEICFKRHSELQNAFSPLHEHHIGKEVISVNLYFIPQAWQDRDNRYFPSKKYICPTLYLKFSKSKVHTTVLIQQRILQYLEETAKILRTNENHLVLSYLKPLRS